MIRKSLATLALAGVLVGAGAGSAMAHECYVAKRSDAGNSGASHSANWYTLKLSDLYADAHTFLGGEALTADQLQLALDMAAEQGLPSSFTLFERFTLPRSIEDLDSVSSKSADGKGIDHFFVRYGDALVGIFYAAQAS
jgi:hypothetical protein